MSQFPPKSLTVGEALPDVTIPVTVRLIVSGAIATRDYEDVHHDKPAAQALGSPDIFMNILTTNGLVGRYVTDWAGPNAELKNVDIKLGAPNYPGDEMTLKGEVSAIDTKAKTAEIQIKGKNSLGYHVTGSVTVAGRGEGHE